MSFCAECGSEDIRCWPHRAHVIRMDYAGNAANGLAAPAKKSSEIRDPTRHTRVIEIGSSRYIAVSRAFHLYYVSLLPKQLGRDPLSVGHAFLVAGGAFER